MTFTGGLRIDGQVHGNVVAANGEPSTLVISEQAKVDGEIRVSHVVVNGTVNGPIVATDYRRIAAEGPGGRRRNATRRSKCTWARSIRGRLNHAEPGTASVVELKRAVPE